MTKDQIIELRRIHKDESLFLITDNAKLYNAQSDKTHIIWDNQKELIHVIRPNTNYKLQHEIPATIESSEYETIQYVGSNVTIDTLKSILEDMKNSNLIDDDKISLILDDYKM